MKQQKEAFGIRVHPDLITKLKEIVEKENNKNPFKNITRSEIVERAIIRYVTYYDSWNK
jgi:hypothetical protein